MDIFMGDWDRHRKQWRWARFPANPLWVPIPEDRDQAFSRYEGAAPRPGPATRPTAPEVRPPLRGHRAASPTNGREQDRQLLAGLTRGRFKAAATELRTRLTDDAIDPAVAPCRRSGARSTALAWPRT